METELLGRAKRETDKKSAREHPRLARASARLAFAVQKLFDAASSAEPVRLEDLWREIETVVPRAELRAAVATVGELVPFVDEDDEANTRARLAERIRFVSGVLRELTGGIEFGAIPSLTATWCSGSRTCSGGSTAPSSPICRPSGRNGSTATRTTGR